MLGRFQERREKTSRELLEAARRVIAFNGYHRTRIADIARAANVGVGTFYLYYPTKQAIFLELVEDTVRKLDAKLDKMRQVAPDPASRARSAVETFLNFAQDNRELFRIVFSHEAAFHHVVKRAQDQFVGDAMQNFEAGMRVGVFRPNPPEIVARAFTGLLVSVVSWWIENEQIPIEDVRRTIADLTLYGLLGEAPTGVPPGR